jgi:uncharacterized 2Fe-2S/4Fe-4S cluster protein (DUF4445 family)
VSQTSRFPEIIDVELGNRTGINYGLALDICTTTIVGLLVDIEFIDEYSKILYLPRAK